MTHLRQRMLEELERRNYSQGTARAYVCAVRQFAEYFHRSPDQLGPEHIRKFQLHLIRERKLAPNTVKQRMAALSFLFVNTLRRPYPVSDIPYPKIPRKLPLVLSPEEVARMIGAAGNLMYRAMHPAAANTLGSNSVSDAICTSRPLHSAIPITTSAFRTRSRQQTTVQNP